MLYVAVFVSRVPTGWRGFLRRNVGDADWVHNMHAHAALEVRIGRDSFVPEHRLLSDDDALAVAIDFRRRHPWRLRLMRTVLGWGDLGSDDALRRFVSVHPFVLLRPVR